MCRIVCVFVRVCTCVRIYVFVYIITIGFLVKDISIWIYVRLEI